MSTMQNWMMAAAIAASAAASFAVAAEPARMTDAQAIERGRYIAKIAGCNDCHTPGYAQKGGKVAEKDWLTGDALGWRGDWGTTYPTNLRTYMQNVTEAQWVKVAKTIQTRPRCRGSPCTTCRNRTCARSIASCGIWAPRVSRRRPTCRRDRFRRVRTSSFRAPRNESAAPKRRAGGRA